MQSGTSLACASHSLNLCCSTEGAAKISSSSEGGEARVGQISSLRASEGVKARRDFFPSVPVEAADYALRSARPQKLVKRATVGREIFFGGRGSFALPSIFFSFFFRPSSLGRGLQRKFNSPPFLFFSLFFPLFSGVSGGTGRHLNAAALP